MFYSIFSKNTGISQMKKTNNTSRKALKSKITKALNNEIKTLPTEMQEILADDLVTAFQNRIKIIKQATTSSTTTLDMEYLVEVGVTVTQ
jgi:hypothetical protein